MRRLIPGALLLLASAVPAQALNTNDILSLVAMPLAVAAVSDLTGVPQDQLADVIATLNNADVPPAEFVQVIRYVPVALVEQQPQEPTFSQWLDTQTSQGITGPALVTEVDHRLATTYQVTPVVEPQRVVYVDETYIPPVVTTRLRPARVDVPPPAIAPPPAPAVVRVERRHPHGGPPGQLKKELGLRTGAEVVHGVPPGRGHGRGNPHGERVEHVQSVVVPPPMASAMPPAGPPAGFIPPGQAKKMEGGGGREGHGHGEGHGEGHGKGHGKD